MHLPKITSFLQESGVQVPRETLAQFATLHRVTNAMREGDLDPAFKYVF